MLRHPGAICQYPTCTNPATDTKSVSIPGIPGVKPYDLCDTHITMIRNSQ